MQAAHHYDTSINLRTRYTGKERDTESGLDYFGARYYANSMGRWMSPDWSAKEEPVPYSKLDNPQSLNLYQYVLNNPLSARDDDGHEIKYVTSGFGALKDAQTEQAARDSVAAILANPNTSANLSGYVGANNPDLYIMSGDLSGQDAVQNNPDGTVTTTRVLGQTDGGGQSVDGGPITQGAASIIIDNRNTPDMIPHTMTHESVHAGEARKDIAGFTKDAKAEKSQHHDNRPQEKRAIGADQKYGGQIAKVVRKMEKDRKKDPQ